MLRIFLYLLVFFHAVNIFAVEEKSEKLVVNEVLFSMSNQVWTSYDLELYHKVLFEVFKEQKISTFSKNNMQDFILSRLALSEALAFELEGNSFVLSDLVKKKLSLHYSEQQILNEANAVSKAMAYVELRESMLKQEKRFQDLMDVLKRKYQFKAKYKGVL